MSSTTRKRASRGLDYYRTPSWCVEAIAPHLPRVPALDPCCGDGAILEALYATAGQSGSHRIVSALRAIEAWLREGGAL